MTFGLDTAAGEAGGYGPTEYVRADLYATQAERIAELEAAINDADSVVTIEINPSNYDHDGVCLLNNQMVEAFSILTAALKGPTHDG